MEVCFSRYNEKTKREPEIVEELLDSLEEKARHYFTLFVKEKKRREKLDRYNFFLQHEMAIHQSNMRAYEAHIDSLEKKIYEIRGDPNKLKDTIDRLDLLYIQLDTLVQALAGVCSHVAFKEVEKNQLIQIVLDYLYPCRSLDPRLNALYGSVYYCRLGLVETPPNVSPVLPVVGNFTTVEKEWKRTRMDDIASYEVPTKQVNITAFDRSLSKTKEEQEKLKEAKKNEKSETKNSLLSMKKQVMELENLNKNQSITRKMKISTEDTVPKSDFELKEEKGNMLADSQNKNKELEGLSIFIHRIENLKHPINSRQRKIMCTIRFDEEDESKIVKLPERCTMLIETEPNKDKVIFNQLFEFRQLPDKKAGIIPSIVINVYDDKMKLARAEKSFIDEITLENPGIWDLLNENNIKIGEVFITIEPIPREAILPAKRFKDEKIKQDYKKKQEPAKSDLLIKKSLSNYKKNAESDESKKVSHSLESVKSSGIVQDVVKSKVTHNDTNTSESVKPKNLNFEFFKKLDTQNKNLNVEIKPNIETKKVNAELKKVDIESKKEITENEQNKNEPKKVSKELIKIKKPTMDFIKSTTEIKKNVTENIKENTKDKENTENKKDNTEDKKNIENKTENIEIKKNTEMKKDNTEDKKNIENIKENKENKKDNTENKKNIENKTENIEIKKNTEMKKDNAEDKKNLENNKELTKLKMPELEFEIKQEKENFIDLNINFKKPRFKLKSFSSDMKSSDEENNIEGIEIKKQTTKNKNITTEIKKSDTEIKKSDTETKKSDAKIKNPITEIKKSDTEIKKSDTEIKKSDTETKKSDAEIKKSDTEIKKSDTEIKKSDTEIKKSDTKFKNPIIEMKKQTIETKNPTIEIEKPTIDIKKPTIEIKKPTIDIKKPTIEIKNPTIETKKPTIEIKEPSIDIKKPTIEIEKPTIEMKKPTIETKNPTIETKNPTIETKNPTIETKNPTIETKNPTIEIKKPSIEIKKPIIDIKNPTIEIKKPTIDIKKPTIEIKKPTIEIKKPTIETKNPTIETKNPTIEIKKPTIEIKKPTIEIKKPTIEIKKPTIEIKKPTIEIKKPIIEIKKPTIEIKKPIIEIKKPTIEMKKPTIEIKKEGVFLNEKSSEMNSIKIKEFSKNEFKGTLKTEKSNNEISSINNKSKNPANANENIDHELKKPNLILPRGKDVAKEVDFKKSENPLNQKISKDTTKALNQFTSPKAAEVNNVTNKAKIEQIPKKKIDDKPINENEKETNPAKAIAPKLFHKPWMFGDKPGPPPLIASKSKK